MIIVLLVSGRDCTAQERDTLSSFVKHYTDEDGLPQNSVKSIIRDEKGFIWLATESGLARFDGGSFDIFDRSNIAGLQSNRMANIYKGWNEKVYAISEKYDYVRIAGGKAVVDTQFHKKDKRLLQELLEYTQQQYWARGLPDMFKVWVDVEKYLIPLGNGSFIECKKDKVIFHRKSQADQVLALQSEDLRGFFLVHNNLYRYDESGRLISISQKGEIKQCLLIGDILHRSEYSEHNAQVKLFWNVLSDNVILYFDGSFYLLHHMPDGLLLTEFICEAGDINVDQLCCSFYDEHFGRLFLGSYTQGLYVLSRRQFRTLHDKERKDQDFYYAQVPYRHNAVLTGHRTVIGLDANGHAFVQRPESALFDSYAVAVSQSDRSIWMKEINRLYRLDSQLKMQQEWKLPNAIDVLYETDDRQLWIGLHDSGIYKMDRNAINTSPEYVGGRGKITYFQKGSNHDLWVGTPSGLFVLPGGKMPLRSIAALNKKHIRSLLFQAPDQLWITTYEDGIFLYAGNKLTNFPEDKDGFLSTTHCIMPDNKGFFWLSTNKGLFQVSKNDLLHYAAGKQKDIFYYYYGKDRGFSTNEFNGGCQPCAARLQDGYLSFPSLDGLVWFNPDKVMPELPEHDLFFDDINIDNTVQRLPGDTVYLPRVFNQLSIGVSTPYFGNQKNVQISYALVKGNGPVSWMPLPADRRMLFSSLPSGTYRLILHKLNGFGKEAFTEKELVLIIAPRFYETWWFLTLMAVLILLTLFVYVRMRMLYVVKTNRRLELRIALRTRKLMNTLRALESSERILRRQAQIQEMLIAAISHDIKTPMKYLTIASEKMQGLLEKKDYESLPVFNKGIHETSSKMYILLDNLLQYIRVQLKRRDISIAPVLIGEVVQEKLLTFRNIAELHYTVIESQVPADIQINTNRELLGVIVHNLIDNAVKNTLNGKIVISTERFNKGVILVIKDTGKGIPLELAEWLNTPAETDEIDIDTASGHMGMGLVIVKELASMISAKILVERPDTGGTRIGITLLYHP